MSLRPSSAPYGQAPLSAEMVANFATSQRLAGPRTHRDPRLALPVSNETSVELDDQHADSWAPPQQQQQQHQQQQQRASASWMAEQQQEENRSYDDYEHAHESHPQHDHDDEADEHSYDAHAHSHAEQHEATGDEEGTEGDEQRDRVDYDDQQHPHQDDSASGAPITEADADVDEDDNDDSGAPRRTERVQVAVRCRPLLQSEQLYAGGLPSGSRGLGANAPAGAGRVCVHVQGKQVLLARSRLFEFDHAFGPDASQQLVYDSCARGLVRAAFRGYNCTVMAYGQTGSGKTYSMGSSSNSGVSEDALGIIPRVVRDLYAQVEIAAGRGVRVETRVSYLEIYNEELRDLLHPSAAAGAGAGAAGSLASTGSGGGGAAGFGRGFAPSQPSSGITIREDVAGGVVLTGVREERVESFADIARALHRGGVGRTTGSTLMNQHSSRSHSIFTINIVQTRLADAAQASSGRAALARKSEVTKSKFHLVDCTLRSPVR